MFFFTNFKIAYKHLKQDWVSEKAPLHINVNWL